VSLLHLLHPLNEKWWKWNLQAWIRAGGFDAECSLGQWLSLLQTYRLPALDSTPVSLGQTSIGVHHGVDIGYSLSQDTEVEETHLSRVYLSLSLSLQGSNHSCDSYQAVSTRFTLGQGALPVRKLGLMFHRPVSRWGKTYGSSRMHALNTETSSDHDCMGLSSAEDTWQAFTGAESQTWRIHQVWGSPCLPRLAPDLLGLSPDVTSARRPSLITLPKLGPYVSFFPIIPPRFSLCDT